MSIALVVADGKDIAAVAGNHPVGRDTEPAQVLREIGPPCAQHRGADRRCARHEPARPTFGPEAVFVHAPATRTFSPPQAFQYFGELNAEGGSGDLRDATGASLWSKTLRPSTPRPTSRERRLGSRPVTRIRTRRNTVVTERTLVLVKPDGVARGLVGEVISRIERKGLKLAALELRTVERSLAEEHYAEHKERPFFGDLLEFITSGQVVAIAVEGPRAIAAFRQLAGGTDPVEKATPGTLRGDYGLETQFNLVHGSDSPESAERELKLWFPDL